MQHISIDMNGAVPTPPRPQVVALWTHLALDPAWNKTLDTINFLIDV
jgi:hypothetical protein